MIFSLTQLKSFTNTVFILVKAAEEEEEIRLLWACCYVGGMPRPQKGRPQSSGLGDQILRRQRRGGPGAQAPPLRSEGCQSLRNSLWSTEPFVPWPRLTQGSFPVSHGSPSSLSSACLLWGFTLCVDTAAWSYVKAASMGLRFLFKKTTFQEWIHLSVNKTRLKALAYRHIKVTVISGCRWKKRPNLKSSALLLLPEIGNIFSPESNLLWTHKKKKRQCLYTNTSHGKIHNMVRRNN